MTLSAGNHIAKLKDEWIDGEHYVIKPYELTAGEMSHVWIVKSIVYETGGKSLRLEVEEVE
jgi:hypothetical protein